MISHGYEVQEENDRLVALVDLATEQFSKGTEPGAFLIDTFPACKSLKYFHCLWLIEIFQYDMFLDGFPAMDGRKL
jgi:hypothetical protein